MIDFSGNESKYNTEQIIMEHQSLNYTRKKGPSLDIKFFVDEKGITEIKLTNAVRETGVQWQIVSPQKSNVLEELIERWMESYLKKRQPEVNLPILLDGLPPYTTRVLSILKDIPFGISLSYKELAEITGNPQGARAVGNACSKNPCPLIIPCHRVLASKGRLGGFNCGIELKKTLLQFEKIAID